MPDEKKFGVSIFGGFKKKSVIEYINNIIVEHEDELKKIKEYNDIVNEQLKNSLDEERALCKEYKEKVVKLEQNVDEYNESVDSVMQQKDELLRLREQQSLQLEEKIKQLEEELEKFKNIKLEEENEIKRAEYIAQERVNKIIRKGKIRIANEYSEKEKQWEKERESLKQAALKEAVVILNNAAAKVSNFNAEFKKKLEGIVKDSEKKAKDIVTAAKVIADEILKKSLKIAQEKGLDLLDSENEGNFKLDFKFLNESTKEEVKKAVKRLESLNLFRDENVKRGFTRDKNFKISKKLNFNSLRRKNKY